MFRRATRSKQPARIYLYGASGSGKTYTALKLARGLVGPTGQIAFVDTEINHNEHDELKGRSESYAPTANDPGVTDFDVVLIERVTPRAITEAVRSAKDHDVLIVDSLSHLWEWVRDQAGAKSKRGLDPWRAPKKAMREVIKELSSFPGHLILCARGRQRYETSKVEKDGRTTTSIDKLGLGPEFDQSFDYELDFVARMDADHSLHVEKCVYGNGIGSQVYERPGERLAHSIRDWLDGGESRAELARKAVAELLRGLESASDEGALNQVRSRVARAVKDLKLTEAEIAPLKAARDAAQERINQAAAAAEEGEAA